MKSINVPRVVLGGLLAGLVIGIGETLFNGFLFADQIRAAHVPLGLAPPSVSEIPTGVALTLALGTATVWFYAAIRPRFGAGVGTALSAGAAVWFFAVAYPSLSLAAMGVFPTGLITGSIVWELGELLLAGAAGASLYQEPGA